MQISQAQVLGISFYLFLEYNDDVLLRWTQYMVNDEIKVLKNQYRHKP
jgi:hypothetical protein